MRRQKAWRGLVGIVAAAGPVTALVGGQETRPTPSPGSASVLDVIPSNAWSFVAVRDLAALDGKLKTFQQQVEFPLALSPTLGLRAYLNVGEGVNDSGEFALALLAPALPEADEDWGGRTLLILPVTDFDAAIKALHPQRVDDVVTRVVLREEASHAAKLGSFALFSEREDVLRQALAAPKRVRDGLSRHAVERFAETDLTWWTNAEAVTNADAVRTFLRENLSGMTIPTSWSNTRQLQVSLRLAPDGLYTAVIAEYPPDRVVQSGEAPASRLLLGLPAQGYVFGGGWAFFDPAEARRTLDEFLITPTTSVKLFKPDKAGAFADLYHGISAHIRVAGFSINLLRPGPDGHVGMVKIIETGGDPEPLVSAIGRWAELMREKPFEDPELNRQWTDWSFAKEAERVGETPVHHLTLDISAREGRAWEATRRILGRDAFRARVAVVGRHVVMTVGGGSEFFSTVLAAVRDGRAEIVEAPDVRKPAAFLPEQGTFGRWHIDEAAVERLVDVVLREYVGGSASGSAEGAHTAVSGVARNLSATSREHDVFIPIDVIRRIKNVFLMGPSSPPAPPAKEPPGADPDR
ncbi:MAG: hypothetical protein FLDDKLPJ_02116 [Phycisphaerae bacterium]|nr:hypothetical protein [Phycisphaerae bacterium]